MPFRINSNKMLIETKKFVWNGIPYACSIIQIVQYIWVRRVMFAHLLFSFDGRRNVCVWVRIFLSSFFFFSFIRKVKNFCVGKQKSIFHFAHEKLDAKCCIWYERKIHTFTLAKRIEHGVSDFSLISKKIVDNNGYNHLGYAQKYASYFHVFFFAFSRISCSSILLRFYS